MGYPGAARFHRAVVPDQPARRSRGGARRRRVRDPVGRRRWAGPAGRGRRALRRGAVALRLRSDPARRARSTGPAPGGGVHPRARGGGRSRRCRDQPPVLRSRSGGAAPVVERDPRRTGGAESRPGRARGGRAIALHHPGDAARRGRDLCAVAVGGCRPGGVFARFGLRGLLHRRAAAASSRDIRGGDGPDLARRVDPAEWRHRRSRIRARGRRAKAVVTAAAIRGARARTA